MKGIHEHIKNHMARYSRIHSVNFQKKVYRMGRKRSSTKLSGTLCLETEVDTRPEFIKKLDGEMDSHKTLITDVRLFRPTVSEHSPSRRL